MREYTVVKKITGYLCEGRGLLYAYNDERFKCGYGIWSILASEHLLNLVVILFIQFFVMIFFWIDVIY